MDVDVNIWGIVAAVVVSMAVGGVWYSKMAFGKTWMELSKIDESKAKEGAMKAMIGMLVLSVVMAFVLAHVAYLSASFFSDQSYQAAALMSAFWMWLGFVLPVTASSSLFSQQPWKLTAINTGNWLVTLLGMGLVIGLIGL